VACIAPTGGGGRQRRHTSPDASRPEARGVARRNFEENRCATSLTDSLILLEMNLI